MHRLAAMLVFLAITCCLSLLATHAQQLPQPAAAAGNTDATPPSCIPHERNALLEFKDGITIDPAGLLDSWRRDEEQDCCRWRGVKCSNRTSHVHKLRLRGTYYLGTAMVGKISPSLLALEHLEHLDLSGNEIEGPTGRIPEFLGSLKSLRYLNLSGILFVGSLPPQLGNLSKLQCLDLSNMYATNSTDLSWLTRLPSIQYLNLDRVDLSSVVDWPHVMNMLPSLRVLSLSACSLASANQSLPHLNLTNLEKLDASWNYFKHRMVTCWFWNITSLKYLYLQYNFLCCQFPNALGDMTSLQVLDLSYNYCYNSPDDQNMNMRIMTTVLMNLCNLEILYLRRVFLYGDITEVLSKLSRCSTNKLRELDLSCNQLTGMLPRWIGQLTGLVVLNLGWNSITGPLPTSIGQLSGLQTLDLSYNNMNGNVPYEIGMLSNLTTLDLSRNKLDGVITEEHFANTRSLQSISLSYNALKIELSSDWQPPTTLDTIQFAACQMGPLFLGWLKNLVNITILDISNAGIADRLPEWFSDDAFSNVGFLNISNNQLNGGLPTNLGLMSSLEYLYLSSNQLAGQIHTLPPNAVVMDFSNNFLSGPLPTTTRNPRLHMLSLFSNQITGHIPESFCEYHGLVALDLSNNLLDGKLPLCLGVIKEMKYLALSNNSLSGEFPKFVQNFTSVVFLDLSTNQFSGRLPIWIQTLTWLIILRLSDNKFSGNIPLNITNLACLQYMDLHKNEISGSMPSYLSNLKAMRRTYMTMECNNDNFVYAQSINVPTVLKGQESNYGPISRFFITNMMSIDLSSNNLTGEIPEEIVALDALVNLNLSRNHLSGVVPNKIGEMQSLESLDLSRNKFSAEIPATLSNLIFLGYLDLSYNNLTGRIPSGPQLDTLYAAYPSMYIGNIGLCGYPLQNSCSNEGDAPKQGGLGITEEDHGVQFFYLGLECGFIVGTWMVFGVLLFKRSCRIACFQLLDKVYDKVSLLLHGQDK